MKCFNHPLIDAVAICKNCQRGLCLECGADLGDGLACKNQCEAQVKALVSSERVSRRFCERSRKPGPYGRLASIALIILGALITGVGVVAWLKIGKESFALIM